MAQSNLIVQHEQQMIDSPYQISSSFIATPKNENQIIEVLQYASQHEYVVSPQGGGSKDAWAGNGCTDILLSTKKMTGILQHVAGDLLVTALPGTTLLQLQDALALEGQFLPVNSAYSSQSTLGGIIAANCSGLKRTKYGSIRDHVVALRVVLSDQRIIRTGAKVVKNVAGYDLNKLMVGSMGTLGILSEITCKIRPLPAYTGLIAFELNSIEDGLRIQEIVLDSQLEPCTMQWVSPEIYGSSVAILVLLFEDVEASVIYQVEWIKSQVELTVCMQCFGHAKTEPIIEALHIVPSAKEVKLEELIVAVKLIGTLNQVIDMYHAVETISEQCHVAFSFSGDLCTGISYAIIHTNWKHFQESIQWVKQVTAYIEQIKGVTIVCFAPVQIRNALDVWGKPREDFRLMQEIKHLLDPAKMLNPGRFVGGI